jgi:hypothetical protein
MDQSRDVSNGSSRSYWGDGRIIYAVFKEQIQELIALEWSMSRIYQHLNLSSNGLTYQQLTYYLKKEQQQNSRQKEKSDTLKLANKSPGQEKKFIPGPRLPDPKQIY